MKTDKRLYDFFKKHGVEEVVFSAITYNDKRGILSVVNPKNQYSAKFLVDETAVCFPVAIYNKKWLNRTQIEATTDVLTGVLNRVAYKKDYTELNIQNPENAACIFVDVNELHIRNNNYGHAAGDEFLVFIQDAQRETIKKNIEDLFAQLEEKDYHVAIGVSYRNSCANFKEMIKDAENRMYDSKAHYYQNKKQSSVYSDNGIGYIQGDFEPNEIEYILLESRAYFSGVLRISLGEDTSHIIMAKAYPGRHQKTDNFSKRFMKYVDEAVHPDYHREVTSFSNYSVLKKQLSGGSIPRISYKKLNGETITLSVYNLSKDGGEIKDTLWIFARS